jgi:CRP-like cAMP-binding protein
MYTKFLPVLKSSQLFKNLEEKSILDFLASKKYLIKKYKKNETIFDKGQQCSNLSIVLEGKIELSNFLVSGDVSSLVTLSKSHFFGEAIIFADENTYPISAVAIKDCQILHISKDHLLELMELHPQMVERYLSLLSKKILFLNDKFKLLSLTSIRGKISHVLLKLSKEQSSLTVKLPFSKEKMAGHISTRRPSLSRELSQMKTDGLIDYEGSTRKILDLEGLEESLY